MIGVPRDGDKNHPYSRVAILGDSTISGEESRVSQGGGRGEAS